MYCKICGTFLSSTQGYCMSCGCNLKGKVSMNPLPKKKEVPVPIQKTTVKNYYVNEYHRMED